MEGDAPCYSGGHLESGRVHFLLLPPGLVRFMRERSLSDRESRDGERFRRSMDSAGSMSTPQEAFPFGCVPARLHSAPYGRLGRNLPFCILLVHFCPCCKCLWLGVLPVGPEIFVDLFYNITVTAKLGLPDTQHCT